MKKHITALLCLLVLASLACVSPAAADDSAFAGVWVNVSTHANGSGETITTLHLTEDHRALFTIQSFREDGTVSGRSASKTWSSSGDTVRVVIGENTSLSLELDGNALRDRQLPDSYYYRVSVPGTETKKGTEVPQGTYIVGKDIPAGVYRLEFIRNSADIFVYRDESASFYHAFASISKFYPEYARLELKEGNVVKVMLGPVLFTAPAGLDFDW